MNRGVLNVRWVLVASLFLLWVSIGEVTAQPAPPPSELVEIPPPPPLPAAPASAAGIQEELPYLEPYNYVGEGRRDPFMPFVSTQGIAGSAALGPFLPLERFDLDELKLTGIVWDVKTPRIMILDPTGQVHTLTLNDRVGRRNGYIAVIREGEVVVVETTRVRGELVNTPIIMKMDR